MERSYAAERAGDAAEALERHLPPWVWARWIVYQVTRCEDAESTTGRLHRTVLKYAVESVHADLLADCEEVAGEVAGEGARPWAAVTAALKDGRLAHSHFLREDYELLTDVQELDLVRFGTPACDYTRLTRGPQAEPVSVRLTEAFQEVRRQASRQH